MNPFQTRLIDYPHVVVRVRCTQCRIARAYRLIRLGAVYGVDLTMGEVMDRLMHSCGYRHPMRKPQKYHATCMADFPDLSTPRPPDLPAAIMRPRLIAGGKS